MGLVVTSKYLRKKLFQFILSPVLPSESKPEKDITRKEIYRLIQLPKDRNPQQNTIKLNPAVYVKDYTP